MILPLPQAKNEILEMVNSQLSPEARISNDEIAYPPDLKFGDLSLPCFGLSKKLAKNPAEIANWLADELQKIKRGFIDFVKPAGPYVNFYLCKDRFTKPALDTIILQKEKYGNSEIGKKQKIMIEYVSPNSNKPLHLGHLRNGFLGESIANLLEIAGYKVIRSSLINDRGIHICKSMLAYKKWGKNDTPQKSGLKSDHFVGKYYVMYEKERQKNPELEKELHSMLKQWENGNKKIIALWKKMNNWAISGFNKTYKNFQIKFDKTYFESKIYKQGKKVIEEGLKKRIFLRDEKGNAIIKFNDPLLPDKIVLRADGTAIYITTDLALAYERFSKEKIDKIIYIVGSEQNLYFRQLFKILEFLGYNPNHFHHLSYGMIFLPSGKMKSREGTVVDADDFLAQLTDEAIKEIKQRGLPQSSKRASDIALSAIKYFILKNTPANDMLFDSQKSLSFLGDTGPYIEYSHARICSILKKAKTIKTKSSLDYSRLESAEEWKLVFELAKFPEILEKSAKLLAPQNAANYLYNLSAVFNDFYEKIPVLKAPENTRASRLVLIQATKTVLSKGLKILGIKPLEKM